MVRLLQEPQLLVGDCGIDGCVKDQLPMAVYSAPQWTVVENRRDVVWGVECGM